MYRVTARLAALTVLVLTAAWSQAAPAVDVAAHGKLQTIGTGENALSVLYLQGTPYEMGYAEGALCKDAVKHLCEGVARLMEIGLDYTPEKVDAVWALYQKHMRPEYIEELRGLADGAGVSLKDVERFHAIPDIGEWHCTFFGARGPATGGKDLIQIRALDYATGVGIQKYPALIVYKPQDGVPFVDVGWLGFCGLVTGMNADGISMSEIGDDWNKNTDNFDACPLDFVMRDAVQFSHNLQQAVDIVKNDPRTSSLLYCLSSGPENQTCALETSHTQCRVYTPKTLPFPTKPGLVYMSMGMDSPWNKKVGDWLLAHYGTIDVETAESLMQTLHTGSLHAVVFRPATLDLWVANATQTEKAYQRPFVHFNLKDALSDGFFK